MIENIVVKTCSRLYIYDFLHKNVKGHSKYSMKTRKSQSVVAQSVGIFKTGFRFPTLVLVQGYRNCL